MADRTIARRYAQAFIELAEEAGSIDATGAELDKLMHILDASDGRVFTVLSNPVFTRDERKRVLDAVSPRLGVSELTRNLLFVLNDKGRMALLPEVVQLYHGFADARAGRVRVLVETAEPLTPQLEAEVIAALEGVTGKDVVIETQVDPTLIGGLVARIGSVVYDASIRTRLENIKQRLLSARTPAQA